MTIISQNFKLHKQKYENNSNKKLLIKRNFQKIAFNKNFTNSVFDKSKQTLWITCTQTIWCLAYSMNVNLKET